MKRELLKDHCVPHMCRDMNNIVKIKPKHEVRVDQFVDVNPYEILADIDFSVVNTCQPVNVNNVVRQYNGETCHEESVLMKNGRNPIKGKKNQFAVSKIKYPSIKGPKGNNCPSKNGVSHDTAIKTPAGVENRAFKTFMSDVATVDAADSDKYELEIQTKLKK